MTAFIGTPKWIRAFELGSLQFRRIDVLEVTGAPNFPDDREINVVVVKDMNADARTACCNLEIRRGRGRSPYPFAILLGTRRQGSAIPLAPCLFESGVDRELANTEWHSEKLTLRVGQELWLPPRHLARKGSNLLPRLFWDKRDAEDMILSSIEL